MRRVLPRVLTLAVIVAATVFDASQPVRAQQQPSFRSGIDVVSLNVTVADGSGRFVTNLERDTFSVFEDGIKQELTFFNRSNLPIALSVLLDTSASMEDKLQTAQDAAIGFVKKLRPQDFGQIIDFDSRVTIAQPFTSSVPDLELAIRKTTAGGSTSLHNAIYISLKELKKIQAQKCGRCPAAGDRRAVGRRRYVEPGGVRRGAGAGEAVRDGHLRDRPARPQPRSCARRVQRSGLRYFGSSRRKPVAACFSRAPRPSSPGSTNRSAKSSRASTCSVTSRAIPSATAAGAGSWSASPSRARRHERSRDITRRHRRVLSAECQVLSGVGSAQWQVVAESVRSSLLPSSGPIAAT